MSAAARALPDPLGAALERLRAGGLVAYPTETVWGLAADARSDKAMAALQSWKGRDARQPVSVLVPDVEALARYGFRVDERARRLARACWPGPLTLVLPQEGGFAPGVARADGAVGVRCSSHPLAAALARRADAEGIGPLTATSLNPSGRPAARTRDEARILCGRPGPESAPPLLLDVEGAEAGGERESTVVDLTAEAPRVLRWGAIGKDQLEPLLAASPGA